MSRRVVCVRFDERELEQLRAAVVIRLRARAAPVLSARRNLGPFIREAALAAAVAVMTEASAGRHTVVPGRSESPRNTPPASRARGGAR